MIKTLKDGGISRIFAIILVFMMLLSTILINSTVAFAEDSSAKVVRIGYYENEIFQEGAKDGAVKSGYAYEYYRKLSEYTGWKYEYVYGDFNEMYKALIDGKVDLLAGLAYKEDRANLFAYPEIAMGNTSYNLVKRSDDNQISEEPASLNGKNIGVIDSAMVDTLEKWEATNNVSARTVIFPNYQELLNAFEKKRVSAILVEGNSVYGKANMDCFLTIGTAKYYVVVNKNREDLLAELNLAQLQLSADDPGYTIGLDAKYYPKSISNRAFSKAEKKWLEEHSSLRIGYLKNYMPYSDSDSNGRVDGIVKDLIPMIVERLGVGAKLAIEYYGFESYADMMDCLADEEIDLAFPVGGGLYYSEENGIYQTKVVVESSICQIYQRNYPLKEDLKIAVNRNNRIQEYYVKKEFPDAEIIFYDSIEDCLSAVMKGKADCTTLDGLRSSQILKNSKYSTLYENQLNDLDEGCFGIKIGNEGLLMLMNRGINALDKQAIVNATYRYSDELFKYTAVDFLHDNYSIFVLAIVAVFCFMMLVILRDNRKKEQHLAAEAARNRELEDARKQAEAASKAKTIFLNNMSHDIRTPMNAILGFAQLMEKEKDNPEVIEKYLKNIKSSGEYLLTIINNVLDMARIESGKAEVDEEFMDIQAQSEDIFSIFEEQIREKNLKFSSRFAVEHNFVILDATKVREITSNLISNAIKYTPAGGSINMSFTEVPCDKEGYATYELKVSDTGIGMSKEFTEQIFESFTRERNTTESKIIGTGLGMTIVKGLVDLLGGTISVESELGKGTTFTVRLTHLIAPNPEEFIKSKQELKLEPDQFKGKRILLAEDNELNAEIAIEILEDEGFEVELAKDGIICVDMLNRAEAGYYDVILMDIQMPNLNGYMATQKIRKLEDQGKANIPIIAMTANAFEEDKKAAKDAGMDGHLSKPINMEALFTELAKALEKN